MSFNDEQYDKDPKITHISNGTLQDFEDRVQALERSMETLQIVTVCLATALYLVVRELYALPEGLK